jgi:hypothetical protein
MPEIRSENRMNLAGKAFPQTRRNNCDVATLVEPQTRIPAARSGVLTTRTDNNTGVVTLSTGHGVITDDRVDVYWKNESNVWEFRYGMSATVAGNAVTVDLGGGDNLPDEASQVILNVAHEEDLVFIGDNTVALGVGGEAAGVVVFEDDANAETFHVFVGGPESAFVWDSEGGVENPFEGITNAKVFFSHVDVGAARQMRVGLGRN